MLSLTRLIYFDYTCEMVNDKLFKLSTGDYVKIAFDMENKKMAVLNESGEFLPFNLIEGERTQDYWIYKTPSFEITVFSDKKATFKKIDGGKYTKPALREREATDEAEIE